MWRSARKRADRGKEKSSRKHMRKKAKRNRRDEGEGTGERFSKGEGRKEPTVIVEERILESPNKLWWGARGLESAGGQNPNGGSAYIRGKNPSPGGGFLLIDELVRERDLEEGTQGTQWDRGGVWGCHHWGAAT